MNDDLSDDEKDELDGSGIERCILLHDTQDIYMML
jgi:hypothetical protein